MNSTSLYFWSSLYITSLIKVTQWVYLLSALLIRGRWKMWWSHYTGGTNGQSQACSVRSHPNPYSLFISRDHLYVWSKIVLCTEVHILLCWKWKHIQGQVHRHTHPHTTYICKQSANRHGKSLRKSQSLQCLLCIIQW